MPSGRGVNPIPDKIVAGDASLHRPVTCQLLNCPVSTGIAMPNVMIKAMQLTAHTAASSKSAINFPARSNEALSRCAGGWWGAPVFNIDVLLTLVLILDFLPSHVAQMHYGLSQSGPVSAAKLVDFERFLSTHSARCDLVICSL
jgi:hypothetical protein